MCKIKIFNHHIFMKHIQDVTIKEAIGFSKKIRKNLRKGTVVNVGPGSLDIEGNRQFVKVNIGDNIIFSSNAKIENIKDIDNIEYFVLAEKDIIDILN